MNMTQAELIRAYWPVLTVEERVQFLTNAAPETEHVTLRGLPESTEGTVFARIGPIGWFEFTGV